MSATSKVTFENRFPQARITLENLMEVGIKNLAENVAVQIANNITVKHIWDTGNYARSWTFKEVSPKEWIIGSPVEYGVYLEYGHHTTPGAVFPLMDGTRPIFEDGRQAFRTVKVAKWVPGRPHIIPAAKTIVSRLREAFEVGR